MPDPIKKKKKVVVSTKPKASGLIQVPAGKGAVRYVSKSSPQGQRAAKAKKALDMKKKGKKLLVSEKKAISKSFNPTKVRKDKPKTKVYKKKKVTY